MTWRIRYARVGNAEPLYFVANEDTCGWQFVPTVVDVAKITGMPMKWVRKACAEARNAGIVPPKPEAET